LYLINEIIVDLISFYSNFVVVIYKLIYNYQHKMDYSVGFCRIVQSSAINPFSNRIKKLNIYPLWSTLRTKKHPQQVWMFKSILSIIVNYASN